MTNTEKTIKKLLDLFEYHNEEEKTCEHCHQTKEAKSWTSFTLDAIRDKTDEYYAMSDLIGNADVDENSAYEWTVEALEAIQENLDKGIDSDEMQEALQEYANNGTDVYNYNLLDWLCKGNNSTFVEDMANEWGNVEPFNWLMPTQCFARENHFMATLEVVRKLLTTK